MDDTFNTSQEYKLDAEENDVLPFLEFEEEQVRNLNNSDFIVFDVILMKIVITGHQYRQKNHVQFK